MQKIEYKLAFAVEVYNVAENKIHSLQISYY